jgi:hypothetical protein
LPQSQRAQLEAINSMNNAALDGNTKTHKAVLVSVVTTNVFRLTHKMAVLLFVKLENRLEHVKRDESGF